MPKSRSALSTSSRRSIVPPSAARRSGTPTPRRRAAVEDTIEDEVGPAVERGAGFDHEVERGLVGECRLEHGRGPDRRRELHGLEDAGDRGQRADQEQPVGGAEPGHREEALDARPQRAAGVHDALRGRRGAGGEHDQPGRIGVGRRRRASPGLGVDLGVTGTASTTPVAPGEATTSRGEVAPTANSISLVPAATCVSTATAPVPVMAR